MSPAQVRRRSRPGGISTSELLVVGLLVALGVVVVPSRREVPAAAVPVARARVEVKERPRSPVDEAYDVLSALLADAVDVQLRGAGRLEITDRDHRASSVYVADGALAVAGPDGETDELLAGVASASFELRRSRGLQDAEPLVDHGLLWSAEPPAGISRAVLLDTGRQLALAFSPRATVPDESNRFEGIDECLIEADLGDMSLHLGRIDGHGKEFCHLRDEPPHEGAHDSAPGMLTLELFQARAPGDARPTGEPLASLLVPMSSLPAASYNWYDRSIGEEILPPEVLEHRAAADLAWWAARPEVVLNVAPTLEQVTVDLSPMQSVVLPGRAYTLLVGIAGDELLAIEAVEPEHAATSGVAMKPAAATVWQQQAFTVWGTLRGRRTFSQTSEVHVPWRVDLHLAFMDGSSHELALDIRPIGAGADGPAPRPPHVQLEGTGRVPTIDRRLRELSGGTSDAVVTRLTGRTLLQDTEVSGLVILEQDSVLYLDDVVLHGSIVSGEVAAGGSAPVVIVDGPLTITSTGLLPGTAVYLPGGELRTAPGVAPPLQVHGDLIAGELELEGHGVIHGQVAAVSGLRVGSGLQQPRMRRAAALRPPGLDR